MKSAEMSNRAAVVIAGRGDGGARRGKARLAGSRTKLPLFWVLFTVRLAVVGEEGGRFGSRAVFQTRVNWLPQRGGVRLGRGHKSDSHRLLSSRSLHNPHFSTLPVHPKHNALYLCLRRIVHPRRRGPRLVGCARSPARARGFAELLVQGLTCVCSPRFLLRAPTCVRP